MIGVVGCKKKEEPYPYGKYTRQEVLDLFNQNRDLFNELVGAILADTYFLENGNVHHDEKTFVMPNQYKYMELFNRISSLEGMVKKLLEKENNKLHKIIDKFYETIDKFIHWICNKFDMGAEDNLIRDFQRETNTFLDPEKQIKKEEREMEWDLEI